MTRNHRFGSRPRWTSALLLAGLCFTGLSGCSKTGGPGSIAGWRPKFMQGNAAQASAGGAPTVEGGAPAAASTGGLKFTVQQPEGLPPIDPGGSILDNAPPPGSFPPDYNPVIKRVPFTDVGGGSN